MLFNVSAGPVIFISNSLPPLSHKYKQFPVKKVTNNIPRKKGSIHRTDPVLKDFVFHSAVFGAAVIF